MTACSCLSLLTNLNMHIQIIIDDKNVVYQWSAELD